MQDAFVTDGDTEDGVHHHGRTWSISLNTSGGTRPRNAGVGKCQQDKLEQIAPVFLLAFCLLDGWMNADVISSSGQHCVTSPCKRLFFPSVYPLFFSFFFFRFQQHSPAEDGRAKWASRCSDSLQKHRGQSLRKR